MPIIRWREKISFSRFNFLRLLRRLIYTMRPTEINTGLALRSPETFANFEQHLLREEIQMNIYVGNLSFDATDEDLQEAFKAFGQVESAQVIQDNYSGRSRGFGFVEMPDKEEAEAAISQLDGTELMGRALKVNEARPRSQRRDRGRGGGRGRNDDRNRW